MPGAGTADCVALIGQVLKRQNPLIPQRVFHCLISEQAFSHCAENGGFEQPIPLVPDKNLGESVAILNRSSCLFAQHLHINGFLGPLESAH